MLMINSQKDSKAEWREELYIKCKKVCGEQNNKDSSTSPEDTASEAKYKKVCNIFCGDILPNKDDSQKPPRQDTEEDIYQFIERFKDEYLERFDP